MFIRQKIVLALLSRAKKPLSRTMFVKLAFLLREETTLNSDGKFYDFVPYNYGPFSFTLYSDITDLRRNGYLIPDEECVALSKRTIGLAENKINELPAKFHEAIDNIVRLYGSKNQMGLMKDVYARYPWYASKSELNELRPKSSVYLKIASPAVYTVGYEGKSVDAFFNYLLKNGIQLIIDVRANPVSRKYGFSKSRFCDIAERLGLDYRHMPNLGIPSKHRVDLIGFDSYQRLLKRYEQEMIPKLGDEIDEVGELMAKTTTVLVCFEKDVRCCHRSRLADAVSKKIGLKVMHL